MMFFSSPASAGVISGLLEWKSMDSSGFFLKNATFNDF
jgi:hypothetical protein